MCDYTRIYTYEGVIFDRTGKPMFYIHEDVVFEMGTGRPVFYFSDGLMYRFDGLGVFHPPPTVTDHPANENEQETTETHQTET
jgi:hypothetical protein